MQEEKHVRTDERFHIISLKHTAKRDKVFTFWRGNNQGYTMQATSAGIYQGYLPGYHESDNQLPIRIEDAFDLFTDVTTDDGRTTYFGIPNTPAMREKLGVEYVKGELIIKPKRIKIIERGAVFSDDQRFRYRLWRVWDHSKPPVMFIGLNPSTANEIDDDPTIRRVVRFAHDWGFGGVYMMNLFAIVSSKPEVLLTCPDPIGDNDAHLCKVAEFCRGEIVFAWGSFKQAKERAATVAAAYPNARCLKKNADGSPNHPLYVRADVQPILFNNTNK